MATKEAQLEAAIRRAVADRWPEAWLFKVVGSPYQMTGVPDLLVCGDGHLVGLEVKHPKPGETLAHAEGRASPTQHVQIERIRMAGGTAEVVTSVEQALEVVHTSL